MCFVCRNTSYAILKISLLGNTAWASEKMQYISVWTFCHQQSGLSSRLPVLCFSCVLIQIAEGKMIMEMDFLKCLVYVFISNCPSCFFFFLSGLFFSGENAFYLQLMIINLCKSIWLSSEEQNWTDCRDAWFLICLFSY